MMLGRDPEHNGERARAKSVSTEVAIAIVNWNTRDLLAQCLVSVFGTASNTSLEVWAVDNASSDGSATMVRERFPQVHLIENAENLGFARANNQALHLAQGRYLLLLNSDTEVQPGALSCLADALERYPEAGAVGPRMLNPDGTLQNSYGSLPSVLDEILGPYWLDFLNKPWGAIGRRYRRRELEDGDYKRVDRVSFACTLIRREALDQVGLLDERFALYSEDYDWFKRLRDAGWQVLFCPQAQVIHHWGASSRQRSDWSLSQLYRSKRLYYAKHYGRGSALLLQAGLIMRFGLKLLWAIGSYLLRRVAATEQMRCQRRLIAEMLRPL